jgi:hypothetical protein
MDTLEIIKRLKKKRPELANDPLMSELEKANMPDENEDSLMAGMPGAAPGSYLDEASQNDGLPMEGSDEEEASESPEEAAMEDDAGDESDNALSYLDGADEEADAPIDEENVDENGMPLPKKKLKMPLKKLLK